MDYDEFVPDDSKFLKKRGNIYISDEQNEILKKYNINVESFKTINELIYCIEEMLNNSSELSDLEWVSATISEFQYYNCTNK